MANDEEIEGMYTLVGDPENPDLEAAESDKPSLTDRIQNEKEVMKMTSNPPMNNVNWLTKRTRKRLK